jgi:large-conductance mechanosensitive channel
MNRLLAALIGYVAIATLAWFTLSGEKIRFGGLVEASPRDFVIVLMMVFAALTLLNHWKERAKARLEEGEDLTTKDTKEH